MSSRHTDPYIPLGDPRQDIHDAESPEGLAPDSVIRLDDADEIDTDVLIIGSGMGGGTLAYALREAGAHVLMVERGGFLPREPENHDPVHMYLKGRYKNAGYWYDGRTGKPFAPGTYYWVGGNTRFYGASLPRFRRSDFTEVEHQEGRSKAWPFSYEDLEPYYGEAERLFDVHGQTDEDPTEPHHSTRYPFPPLPHEPAVERLAESMRVQGLNPFHTPNAMNITSRAERIAVATADGCPDDTGIKAEAENKVIVPALQTGHVKLMVRTEVTRLLPSDDGRRLVAAEARHLGRVIRINARRVVLAAGAVNSAALLLRSATRAQPDGLGNSSGLLGRNYMVHNSTFLVGVNPLRTNDTHWQKTLGMNDFYEAGASNRYPLGNLQMLGKLRAPMLKPARQWAPMWALKFMSARSIDIYLTTEDLPSPDNRVRVDGDRILIDWVPTNVAPHHELVRRVTRIVRKAGYPFIFTQQMGIETNSHMCGTAVAGHDPSTSVLDATCRSHDLDNLWIADASFFPSSAALNPALTIAANALRIAPSIVAGL
ncbi:GMC oxidoreductase [Actinomadura madurae]|uniref:GMC oxidoreductase n=1 Tax=Actinomadura madurae TaxID=1993 RepID=UPI0020D21CAF|nr:GMC family oxidoreductase [Actinomadura madurae]MCP9950929.1 GMC family oxidoreductase [Actinomadura madurae]MCP9967720.1 GMC family oxidoreductase [Actinomadura madurae]MCP9980163.1 GMC family oxidoreductase [Actinomadura madurae]MCQ0008308.1 GMC family oxidoreductase [Actinomadura madurae]MCQ0016375.1 GMC family oxidoreductase [Actinomadura madurae]